MPLGSVLGLPEDSSSAAATMNPAQAWREFVGRRLSDAAGEIFSLFLPTLVQYQETLQTQQRLLERPRPPRTGERQERTAGTHPLLSFGLTLKCLLLSLQPDPQEAAWQAEVLLEFRTRGTRTSTGGTRTSTD